MKVLISDKIDKKGIETLKEHDFEVLNRPDISREKLLELCKDVDAMIVRSGTNIDKELLDNTPNLKIIARAGVGYDNIDTGYAKSKGIVVENTPQGNTNAAAEHTITLLMMLTKHIIHSNEDLKKGNWNRKNFKGREVKEKTLGIIGLGHVGRKVAKVANALEMNVLGFDPFVEKKEMEKLNITKVDLEELIKKSDFLTVHVPKNEKTINLISKKEFEKMKDGVRILNVARGGIINENDLADAIKSGKVAAAGIDVWENEPPKNSELLNLKQVIATPHLGASTKEAQVNVAKDAANQVIAALTKGKITNCVNDVKEVKQT